MTARERFDGLVAQLVTYIGTRPLDKSLEQDLNSRFPAGGTELNTLQAACLAGIEEGWMCSREGGGIRYGRVTKPSEASGGFSVDVVDMNTVRGPHHGHPNGEIDLIMPLETGAQFDGQGAGWLVYEAGTAHYPTVTGGRALVLYLLPAGAIEFTK
ncbi:MAG: hypothetical protein RLZZ200_970 [Pseudomonadota bacterium]|jgi:hypothetical protein